MLLTFSAALTDFLVVVNGARQPKAGQAMNAIADVALSCKLSLSFG